MTSLMEDVKKIRERQQEYRVEIEKLRKLNKQIREKNEGLKSEIGMINNRLEYKMRVKIKTVRTIGKNIVDRRNEKFRGEPKSDEK